MDVVVDTVDYALLKCIADYEEKPWKKKLFELLQDRRAELPGVETVSLQTVGRRVDRLQDKGLIDSCITSSEEIRRELIIGYKLTATGTQALTEKRDDLLKQAMFRTDDGTRKKALIELLQDEFELSQNSISLLTSFDQQELTTLFAFFYMRRHLDEFMTDENRDVILQLLEENPHLADMLNTVVQQKTR